MDIVTHAGIGLIAAAPVLNSHPELALGLVAGSVLPDLDALSRVFGKRAYLRSHQTWSHAIPVQAACGMLAGGLAQALGFDGWPLGVGLFAGLSFHTLLDFANTLGVTLLAPFSRRRFCLAWVFFIDAIVALFTSAAAAGSLWSFYRRGEVPMRYSATFFAVLVVYILGKGMLHRRCRRFAPEAISLIPSALWPWRFFGVAEGGHGAQVFQISAITGQRKLVATYAVLDATHAALLAGVPEFNLMRELSPAYHVVKARPTEGGELVTCRDLRTRNFQTTFGDLDVLLDAGKRVIRITFHV